MSCSDALKTAIQLFHRQFQLFISEENADNYNLAPVLSALIHLNPFQVMDSGELGFLWITEIFNSGYQGEWREQMVGVVLELLGKHLFLKEPVRFIDVEPAWIPPLLGYSSLNEKLDSTRPPGFIALRILATSQGSADFGPTILPILASSLLPTHRLQARRLALTIFERFKSGWFSSLMEDIPSKDLEGLVQAVGDPFQSPDLPLWHGKPVDPPYYDPTRATAVLIAFASSDLWRNHLQRSNFTSFEEIASTWDGKKTALKSVSDMGSYPRTAAKISTAIRRLEELQCPNAVEVVIMWAWTAGVVNPVDREGWRLIGRDTLRFYQTHGVERPTALRRHLADISGYLLESGEQIMKLPVLKLQPDTWSRRSTYLHLSQTCQVRRLYQLFGYDPTMWREAVKVEEVDEKAGVSSGSSVALAPFVGWACDYP